MAFRFKLDEGLTANVRRLIRSQLGIAVKQLAAAEQPEREIHEARKAIKRTRALLRLVRHGLERGVFEHENRKLAAIGRSLSGIRDLHVLLQTAARLELARPDCAGVLKGLQHRIGERIAAQGRTLDPALVQRAHARLLAARKHIIGLAVTGGVKTLQRGLAGSHKAAHEALGHALAKQQTEILHELRKHAQHHWRQMNLLQAAWPQAIGVRAAAARELSQLLGEEHDLAVLQQAVATRGPFALPADERRAIVEACAVRRAELWTMIAPRVCRVFAEPAGAFAKSITALWRVARKHPDRIATSGATAASDQPGNTSRRPQGPTRH